MVKGLAAGTDVSERMNDLKSPDKDRQNRAFQALSALTQEPVEWGYDVWDELLRLIAKGDNRQRSIAGQLLCDLAKSDPQQRMIADAPALIMLTRDERFVTARHCLLALWKVAAAGDRQRKAVTEGLSGRFKDCRAEKNSTLIRYDIQCVFKKIYEISGDEELRIKAQKLIDLEEDARYRRKYATVWRGTAPLSSSS